MEKEKRYILTNIVSATPMSKREFHAYVKGANNSNSGITSMVKGLFVSEKQVDLDGYLVNMCGNVYWFPKKVFESMSIEVIDNKELPSRINVDESMVNSFIHSHDTMTIGNKTTVVRATLQNGYEIIESSSCVDDNNYDVTIGEEVCLSRIKDRVWDYLGFLLQTARNNK